MPQCHHKWEMTNVRFGFIAFEKCYHCDGLRTYFTEKDLPLLGDKYREGNCFWSRVGNAQALRFDIRCQRCGHIEKLDDLMGLMHCTGCLPDCEVDILQKKYESERTWLLIAFGFFDKDRVPAISSAKLDILTDYFNQRRDTSRSLIKIVSSELIIDLSRCQGDFIHDVDMLSLEAPGTRTSLF
jgi:hypothetical protein